MNRKIALNFFFVIIAIIVGAALFKQFNAQNLNFEQPGLALIYGIVFTASIGLMIKRSKRK